jgi:hypothetical protein
MALWRHTKRLAFEVDRLNYEIWWSDELLQKTVCCSILLNGLQLKKQYIKDTYAISHYRSEDQVSIWSCQ